jgi:IS605 OrfB family transposase
MIQCRHITTGKVKRSKNRKKAIKRLAKGYLKVSRQRNDFARKQASALVKSRDFIAYEDLQIAHLGKNHQLAKSISDASWGLFLSWVRSYGSPHGIPVVAVPARFTTQDCVSLWLPGEEKPQYADPHVPQLWPGAGPGLERGPEDSLSWPGMAGCPPYRRAGGNGVRFAGTERFWTDTRLSGACTRVP